MFLFEAQYFGERGALGDFVVFDSKNHGVPRCLRTIFEYHVAKAYKIKVLYEFVRRQKLELGVQYSTRIHAGVS